MLNLRFFCTEHDSELIELWKTLPFCSDKQKAKIDKALKEMNIITVDEDTLSKKQTFCKTKIVLLSKVVQKWYSNQPQHIKIPHSMPT